MPRRSTAPRVPSAGGVDATPQWRSPWAVLVYVLAVLTLAWPALTGQFLVAPHSDQYIAGYAFREFAAAVLRQTGAFPQWNPYLFGGMPYVAAMHGDIFYPTFLLRLLLPTDVAMTWGFIIHLVLAGTFAFGFLRASGLTSAGALLGGLAYMLGGQLASLVSPGHDGKLFVSALFPLALWMLLRWIRDGRRWAPPVLAIVVGLAVLSPHPQLLQYMLLASGSYALFIAVRAARAGEMTGKGAVIRLGVALGAVALGGLMGAIQYLPVREYVAWSPRAGGIRDYAVATSYAWPPEELLDAYLPQFSGILEAYWGRNGIHFHSQYAGVSVLMLALAAFAGARRDPRRAEIWFWTAALIVALLWSLGGHTPFYRLPYAIIPGTKFFRAPATIFFVGAMAIAFLAAIGTERVLGGRVGMRYLVGWGAFGGAIALLATTGVLTSIAQTLAPPEMMDRVSANSGAVTIGAWRSLAVVAAIGGVVLSTMRGKLNARYAILALAAIVVIDSWSVMRHYWNFSPPAKQLYAADATIDYLRARSQPARVLARWLSPEGVRRDANIVGDGLMIHRVRNTQGYHGNQLARYDALLGYGGADQATNPQFWRLSNTQYLLTNVDSIPGLTRVAGPTTTAAGTRVSLFDLPGEQPYAWIAPLIVKASDEAVIGTVLDPRFDVGSAALFDTAALVRGVERVEALPPPLDINASVTRYEPGRVSVALDRPAPAGSALVVSENFYPGWRATVDGRPGSAGRADFAFIGVELPRGARRIDLTFKSSTYRRGKTITLIAITVALAWLVGATVIGRGKERGA